MRRSIALAAAGFALFVMGQAAAAPTPGQATADERAAIAKAQKEIAADYAAILKQELVIRAEHTDNVKLYNAIKVLKLRLAAQARELVQDAYCAMKLQSIEAGQAKLAQKLKNADTEVAQDQSELKSAQSIAAAQKKACDAKVAHKEDAKEIAACQATLKVLTDAVAKERTDLAQSQARAASVKKEIAALNASGAFCRAALKENNGTTNPKAATADERAAIAKIKALIAAKYNAIATNRADIGVARTKIAELLKAIEALRAQIAKNRAEALGDALCAIYLKQLEASLETLKTRVAALETEVAQDAGELEAAQKIAAAQKALCDKKVANKEDKAEINSCNVVLAELNKAVAKEVVDLGQAKKALNDAKAALSKAQSAGLACKVAVKN